MSPNYAFLACCFAFILGIQPVNGQFSTAVKKEFQKIYDQVFEKSRCDDRTRCVMAEWDYVKEMTNDLDNQFVGPTVFREPGNYYFNKGNTDPLHFAFFTCQASEDMDDIAFYKWFKDGIEVQVNSPENIRMSIAGGRLDINNPVADDEGGYFCAATNKAGTALSRTRNLYAAYVTDFDQTERSVTVSANQVAIIPCNYPKDFFKRLDFFWKRQILSPNGTLLDKEEFIEQNDRFIIDENYGNLYMIKPNKDDLNRAYRCVVRNEKEYEQETNSYDFVYGPQIAVKMSAALPTLDDLSIKFPSEGFMEYETRSTRNITMYCIADGGFDLLTYSWNVPHPEVGNQFFRYQGAKLEIINATLDNNGEYECRVRNQNREVSVIMTLYVYERPLITKPLRDRNARAGEDFILTCEASAEPAPAYRWYFNGKEITDTNLANGNALAFYQVSADKSGMYQCEAYNEHGNAMTTSQVRVDEVEPIFISQLGFRVDQKYVFEEGYVGKIKCSPFAIPVPIFNWSFQNKAVKNSTKYQLWLDGTLFISKVTGMDAGDYKCTAQGAGNSESMSFTVQVIPQVDLQIEGSPQVTLVHRTLDLKCELASENPADGVFMWSLNELDITPSKADMIITIEQMYRRLDKIFGSDDFAFKMQKDMDFALNGMFPFFYDPTGATNPFYPLSGPGSFSRSDATTKQQLTTEQEWEEIKKWDPYDPYKSREQFERELKAEKDIVMRYYETDLPWYVESQFRDRQNLHYIWTSSNVKNGTLRLYRPQKWQQGTYKCCYVTLYGQTCKEVDVSVIDIPPEPANLKFNRDTKVLSWGNPGRGSQDNTMLPIDKFLIEVETVALYPVPMLMRTLPSFFSYRKPDPFTPDEGAMMPPSGFVKIAEAPGTATSIDLSKQVFGYTTVNFQVKSVNAVGTSPRSQPTTGIIIPQSPPKSTVKNIRAGYALRGKTKRLLAIAFDPVPVKNFEADGCFFKVFYRETGPNNGTFQLQTMRSPFQTQLTVQLPMTSDPTLRSYDVQVQIGNKEGLGPKSEVVVIKEVPLPTTETVTDIKVEPLSGNSVRVSFKGVDKSKVPGFFGYQVQYFKFSENDFDMTNNLFEISPGNATLMQEIFIYELEPAMNYKFVIYVVNAGGLGTATQQVYGETLMAPPSPQPKNVRVYSYEDGHSIRVRWDPVVVGDGEAQLEGYYVFYWLYRIKDSNSAVYIWERQKENDEEAFIRDLIPGERYNIVVQPFSKGGMGKRSGPVSILMRQTFFNEKYRSGLERISPNNLVGMALSLISVISFLATWG